VSFSPIYIAKYSRENRHLAKDEMNNITEDKWDEDIWGIEHADASSVVEIPKLFFYFGADVSELCWPTLDYN
jgi:hypothetical protein